MTVKLSNIKFNYSKKYPEAILNIPSWSVKENEQVFIHGESGSGKSTLLKLISGLLQPSEGSIFILGQDVQLLSNSKRDKFRSNNIGYISQQFNLIPYLNPIENILLANNFSDYKEKPVSHIHDLLNTLNISESDRKKPVNKMSVGQQQRIAIARAFINKPKLIIADEPTSSLDENNCAIFITLLKQLTNSNNSSLIFVSHDLSLAQHFDRVEKLNDINILSRN